MAGPRRHQVTWVQRWTHGVPNRFVPFIPGALVPWSLVSLAFMPGALVPVRKLPSEGGGSTGSGYRPVLA